MNEKVMLLYPPGKLYQRGEDRCQAGIEDSTASAVRACNDLGYCAAALEARGYEVFLHDYQTERKSFRDVESDINNFCPDMIMISVTNATIFEDITFTRQLRKIRTMKIVLKGAIFFNPENEMLSLLKLEGVDFLIGGEAETCIGGIADYALRGAGDINKVDNILFKDGTGRFCPTRFQRWTADLDAIPFPARGRMNNKLYVRPDTQEPMATIQTSRGCSASCIYCLSPVISGKKIRFRTPENVMAELEECYYRHHIHNFFFKADTFTMNAEWTKKLCDLIIQSPLHGKIEWTANSRTNPLAHETLEKMKAAGCFAVAFGFESGSEDTLARVKKGTTAAWNLQAAAWCHELKLKVFGFYMIGFPWETQTHLAETRAHIFETRPDFLELHLALPYYGTQLYSLCKERGVLAKSPLGTDYFQASVQGTEFVSGDELLQYRKKLIRDYYLRPRYILSRLGDCLQKPNILLNYMRYGIKLLKNNAQ